MAVVCERPQVVDANFNEPGFARLAHNAVIQRPRKKSGKIVRSRTSFGPPQFAPGRVGICSYFPRLRRTPADRASSASVFCRCFSSPLNGESNSSSPSGNSISIRRAGSRLQKLFGVRDQQFRHSSQLPSTLSPHNRQLSQLAAEPHPLQTALRSPSRAVADRILSKLAADDVAYICRAVLPTRRAARTAPATLFRKLLGVADAFDAHKLQHHAALVKPVLFNLQLAADTVGRQA